MSKISIIVPVYNVEQYLHKCMDSIINQTFKDIEIICINDGSTDNSLEILNNYAKIDSRITIINQKNGGLSDARNSGLKIATAPYTIFVDSDDWIELNACEILYNEMTSNNCDLVIAKTNIHNETKFKQNGVVFDKKLNSFSRKVLPNDRCYNIVNFGAWNKLYKKCIIDQYKMDFPTGLYFEDAPFLFSYITVSKNILYIEDKLYNYRLNQNSILSSLGKKNKNNIRVLDHFRICLVFYDFLNKNNLFKKYEIEFWNIFCEYIWYPLLKLKKQYLVFNLANDFLSNKKIEHLNNKISKINYKMLLYLKNKKYGKIYTQEPKNILGKIKKLFYYKKVDITKDFIQINILSIPFYKKKKNITKIIFFKIKR